MNQIPHKSGFISIFILYPLPSPHNIPMMETIYHEVPSNWIICKQMGPYSQEATNTHYLLIYE